MKLSDALIITALQNGHPKLSIEFCSLGINQRMSGVGGTGAGIKKMRMQITKR